MQSERGSRKTEGIAGIPEVDFRPSYGFAQHEPLSTKLIRGDLGEFAFTDHAKIQEILTDLFVSGEMARSMFHYPEDGVDPARESQRKLLELQRSDTPILFHIEGSNGLLRDVIATAGTRRVWGIGISFPNARNFTQDTSTMAWGNVPVPMGVSLDESFEIAKSRNALPKKGEIAYYVNTPNIQGDSASLDALDDFAKFCADRRYKFIIDEGFAYKSSAARLVEEYGETVAVLRTFSKEAGFPGIRVGIGIVPDKWARRVEDPSRKPEFYLPGPTQLFINALSNPDFLGPYLDEREAKKAEDTKLMEEVLKEWNIDFLKPRGSAPLFVVYGEKGNFCEKAKFAGVSLTPGSVYRRTSPWEMSDRYGRLVVPDDRSLYQHIAKRLDAAKNAGDVFVDSLQIDHKRKRGSSRSF